MLSKNKIRNKDNKEGGGIWKLKDTKRREKLYVRDCNGQVWKWQHPSYQVILYCLEPKLMSMSNYEEAWEW